MADNPLVSGKKAKDYVSKYTAAEWAAMAREGGHFEQAKAWDAKALELGEERIPNGITVRFRKDGSTERVSVGAQRP